MEKTQFFRGLAELWVSAPANSMVSSILQNLAYANLEDRIGTLLLNDAKNKFLELEIIVEKNEKK